MRPAFNSGAQPSSFRNQDTLHGLLLEGPFETQSSQTLTPLEETPIYQRAEFGLRKVLQTNAADLPLPPPCWFICAKIDTY